MSARGRETYAADELKRAVDVLGAAALLVITWPLIALVACGVWISMGRPLLYRDIRAGRHGRPFVLLKFRTMRPPAPGETIPDADAVRMTRLGRVLRATSVDELPTLLNVVRGDMSLVGPRPLPVRYVERYREHQARRLEVRPGITGLAQVEGRNETTWTERLALDVWYVDHRSWRLDFRILLRTVAAVVRRRGISREDHPTMPEFDPPSARTHA